MLSAVVGCAIRLALKDVLWVSAALGMSLALVVMMLTKTVHPPGDLPIWLQIDCMSSGE